jgi:hypothetical protein
MFVGLVKIHDENAMVAGTSQQEPFPRGVRDEHSSTSSGFKP